LTNLSYHNQSSALLKGYSLAYDGANNLVRKNDDTFVYDGLNQLLFANLKGKFEVDGQEEVQKVGRVLTDYQGDGILDFAINQLELIELDYAAGSIGVDLLGTFPVTRVALIPNNPNHRVEARHLSLYGSLDGFTYEKIDGWTLEKKDNGAPNMFYCHVPYLLPTQKRQGRYSHTRFYSHSGQSSQLIVLSGCTFSLRLRPFLLGSRRLNYSKIKEKDKSYAKFNHFPPEARNNQH